MRYKPSNVSSKYGAPMGRDSSNGRDLEQAPGKLCLQRVRLDSGGYDSGGAYWGHGEPLYVATDHENTTVFVRAMTRDGAKHAVRLRLAMWDGCLSFHR
jgi:hypothetical protein